MSWPATLSNLRTLFTPGTPRAGVESAELSKHASAINALESNASATGHAHVEGDVTSLGADLAAKAPLVHAHGEGDVTSLTADLTARELVANKGVANGYMGLDANQQMPSANYGVQGLFRTLESFGIVPGGNATVQANGWGLAKAWLQANGGGELVIGAIASYANLPQLELSKNSVIRGVNQRGCIVSPVNNLNTDFILNHVSTNGTTDANAQRVQLRNFCIEGNKANQTSGNGVRFNSNPSFGTQASADDGFDMWQVTEDLFIQNCKQDGLSAVGRSSNYHSNTQAYYCDGNGLTPSFDSALIGCNAGQSGLIGLNIAVPAVRATGCKLFYSGNVTASSGFGCQIQGFQGICNLSDLEVQDNRASGLVLTTGSNARVQGGADSNGTSSAGTYPAVDIWQFDHFIVDMVCIDRQWDGVHNTQLNALRVRSGSTIGTIKVTHKAVAGAVGAPILTIDADASQGVHLTVNNSDGAQYPAFAASYTPDPTLGGTIRMTLTANVTINLPAAGNFWKEQVMTFYLSQDATGGRTITWNGGYKGTSAATTTASTVTIARFRYDGTNWRAESFLTGQA